MSGGRAGAAALAAGCLLAAGVAGASSEADLEALQQRIQEAREQVGRSERDERALLERLEDLDRRGADLAGAIREARTASRQARSALASARGRAREAAARLEETRRVMSRRVVALYKAGEVGPLRLLFSSSSLSELLARTSMLRRVLDHDARLVARAREQSLALERAEAEAAEASRRESRALAILEEGRAGLEAERSEKRRLLATVREDRSEQRALLIELVRAARALEETLARLGDEAGSGEEGPAGSGLDARQGRLPPPILAEVRAPFGLVVDREFQTETFRKGILYAAEAGESVRAIAPARVRFAGWFRGYGRIVILDHGDDFFTVSGHLDEIFVEVGEAVEANDIIGTVGETGSLTGPGLYFELRRGSSPLDPAAWLAAG